MRRLDTRRDAILALVIPARARLLFDTSGVEWRARAPPPPVTTYKKQERAAPPVKFAALASVVHAHVTRGSCIKVTWCLVCDPAPQLPKTSWLKKISLLFLETPFSDPSSRKAVIFPGF